MIAFTLPSVLPGTSRFPSEAKVMIGFKLASSPIAATVRFNRPPLARYSKVSTAAKILTFDLIASTFVKISSAASPCAASLDA